VVERSSRKAQSDITRRSLRGGFWLEEAAEAGACELHTDYAFAGFGVADVDYAALGGEVGFLFLAAGAEMELRDPDFEVGADGHVETRAKRGATSAEIFAGSFFFEVVAAGIASADFERQADGNPTFRARFRRQRAVFLSPLGRAGALAHRRARRIVPHSPAPPAQCAPHARYAEARHHFPHRA